MSDIRRIRGVNKTLTTTANTDETARDFYVRVTTSGSIFARFRGGNEDVEFSLPVGSHVIEGDFVQLWLDGTIALSPTDQIVAY